MIKLKEIIKESKFAFDRKFGEPLPTFKDVMEKHQVNKLKEDWWDDMSPEDQASYIKKHPGSKQAQSAKDKEEPKKDVKGREYDPMTGKGKGKDSRNEPDDEEYFKSMMTRTGDELNQETLTINGKQFRRISESVEKEEKPKYEFSEFYQRFKR